MNISLPPKKLNIGSVESDFLHMVEEYFQKTIKLVDDENLGVILYFNKENNYHEKFIPLLLAKLLQYKGSAWFIDSHIMIDSNSDELKTEITDMLIAMLQSDMVVTSAVMDKDVEVINARNWYQLPVVRDRLATEEDVTLGNAIFYLTKELGIPSFANITLPQCALYQNEDGNKIPAIIVQVEGYDDEPYVVGMYKLDGSKFIGTANEVQLMTAEELFKRHN